MKKQLNFWTLFPAFLITVGVLLLTFRIIMNRRNKPEETSEPNGSDQGKNTDKDEPEIDPELNKDERIIQHFKLFRKVLPEDKWNTDRVLMLLAVSMHETGVFTSRLYKEQNNLFGMRHPSLRETKSLKMMEGYALFSNLEDSILDLMLYFDALGYKDADFKDVQTLVTTMSKKKYFTANYVKYFNAVRSHYNKAKSLIQ